VMQSKRRPSVAALNRRFHTAYSRHLELLTNGDWPNRSDVEAWNTWHAERAEVDEELAGVYADLRDRVTDIANVEWHGYQAAHRMWADSALQHRGHIEQIGGEQ